MKKHTHLAITFCLLALAFPRAASADLRVTLLGTGDPTPRLDRFGPSTLVETPGAALLFDAGRGTMQRLYQLDVSTSELDAIFLTHLHSDHVVGLVDVWLTGWVVNRREQPLKVYGPVGTAALMENLRAAFDFDIAIRTDEARRSPAGVQVDVVEIEPGYRWEHNGTTVLAIEVDHSPIEPAFGFRVDAAGRSVALSGDTRYSASFVEQAQGVDLLIHEVAEAPEDFKARNPHLPRLAHHTQAVDAGRVFRAVAPQLAVYSHLVLVAGFTADELVPRTRQSYDGPLVVGEDLMVFVVGDSVAVHRHPRGDGE